MLDETSRTLSDTRQVDFHDGQSPHKSKNKVNHNKSNFCSIPQNAHFEKDAGFNWWDKRKSLAVCWHQVCRSILVTNWDANEWMCRTLLWLVMVWSLKFSIGFGFKGTSTLRKKVVEEKGSNSREIKAGGKNGRTKELQLVFGGTNKAKIPLKSIIKRLVWVSSEKSVISVSKGRVNPIKL